MTDQSQTVQDQAAEEAQRIAEEKVEVRQRTRDALLRAARAGNQSIGALGDLARSVFDGAVQGVRDAAPKERENVLRQVIDGLADGFTTTANATRLALEEARGRGQRFAQEDVRRALDELGVAQARFLGSISRVIEGGARELGGEVRDLGSHAARAIEGTRPAVQAAMEAATKHPVKLTTETAAAGARGTAKAAGALLHAMAGMLDAAAETLSPKREEPASTGRAATPPPGPPPIPGPPPTTGEGPT